MKRLAFLSPLLAGTVSAAGNQSDALSLSSALPGLSFPTSTSKVSASAYNSLSIVESPVPATTAAWHQRVFSFSYESTDNEDLEVDVNITQKEEDQDEDADAVDSPDFGDDAPNDIGLNNQVEASPASKTPISSSTLTQLLSPSPVEGVDKLASNAKIIHAAQGAYYELNVEESMQPQYSYGYRDPLFTYLPASEVTSVAISHGAPYSPIATPSISIPSRLQWTTFSAPSKTGLVISTTTATETTTKTTTVSPTGSDYFRGYDEGWRAANSGGGYFAGFSDGENDGYSSGYRVGFRAAQTGKKAGAFTEAYLEGEARGYYEGYYDGEEGNSYIYTQTYAPELGPTSTAESTWMSSVSLPIASFTFSFASSDIISGSRKSETATGSSSESTSTSQDSPASSSLTASAYQPTQYYNPYQPSYPYGTPYGSYGTPYNNPYGGGPYGSPYGNSPVYQAPSEKLEDDSRKLEANGIEGQVKEDNLESKLHRRSLLSDIFGRDKRVEAKQNYAAPPIQAAQPVQPIQAVQVPCVQAQGQLASSYQLPAQVVQLAQPVQQKLVQLQAVQPQIAVTYPQISYNYGTPPYQYPPPPPPPFQSQDDEPFSLINCLFGLFNGGNNNGGPPVPPAPYAQPYYYYPQQQPQYYYNAVMNIAPTDNSPMYYCAVPQTGGGSANLGYNSGFSVPQYGSQTATPTSGSQGAPFQSSAVPGSVDSGDAIVKLNQNITKTDTSGNGENQQRGADEIRKLVETEINGNGANNQAKGQVQTAGAQSSPSPALISQVKETNQRVEVTNNTPEETTQALPEDPVAHQVQLQAQAQAHLNAQSYAEAQARAQAQAQAQAQVQAQAQAQAQARAQAQAQSRLLAQLRAEAHPRISTAADSQANAPLQSTQGMASSPGTAEAPINPQAENSIFGANRQVNRESAVIEMGPKKPQLQQAAAVSPPIVPLRSTASTSTSTNPQRLNVLDPQSYRSGETKPIVKAGQDSPKVDQHRGRGARLNVFPQYKRDMRKSRLG